MTVEAAEAAVAADRTAHGRGEGRGHGLGPLETASKVTSYNF